MRLVSSGVAAGCTVRYCRIGRRCGCHSAGLGEMRAVERVWVVVESEVGSDSDSDSDSVSSV